MEIIAWCEKQSTCSGQWTSPPIGDSRWTTLAVAEIGWNLRDAILETHLWTSEMVSTQIYQIKDLWSFSYCSQNFYFHDILVGFCYLIFIYLCISGFIFWGFLEFLDASEHFNKTGNDYRIKDWTMKFSDKIQEN